MTKVILAAVLLAVVGCGGEALDDGPVPQHAPCYSSFNDCQVPVGTTTLATSICCELATHTCEPAPHKSDCAP